MGRMAGKGRHYTVGLLDADGNATSHVWKFVSVTSVLDAVVAKPRLQYWYYSETVNGISTIMQKYGAQTPTDAASLKGLLKQHKVGPMGKRDAKSSVGTDVHDDLEKLAKGKAIKPNANNDSMRTWWDEKGLSPADVLATEVPLVSFKYGYAGTCDLIYRDPSSGRIVLTDLKTGSYIDWTKYIQGEAYKLAWEEEGGQPIDLVTVLHAAPGNKPKETAMPQATPEAWLNILAIYKALPDDWMPEEA